MIYLDCAATSMQKPRTVQRAVQQAMETMASPGRGSHAPAMRAADMAYRCREALADMFHVPQVENVVFTFNATHALNIAIFDLVAPGDKVVVSGYEHNSVMRPLYQRNANVEVVRTPLFNQEEMLRGFARALPGAKAAVCTAMSNVFGYITPIEKIAELCRYYQVPLIVDASQAAGCMELNFAELGAVYMAMPGHKGLLGPQGTGVLLCSRVPVPFMAGGTGSDSRNQFMPEYLPDGLEAGTHNIPGIAGLLAGVEYVRDMGTRRIVDHERAVRDAFVARLREMEDLEVFYTERPGQQGGVVSLRHQTIDCETLTEALGRAGVAVRGGLHCSPCAHETAGTENSGTVRFSFSPFVTIRDGRMAAELTKHCVNNLKT